MDSNQFHFIGIGGIGMSALARILLQQGAQVKGSDIAPSPLIEELIQEGALVWTSHKKSQVLDGTVIYSSAISETNGEFIEAKRRGLKMLHRSDLLDELMREKSPLQVTGTHGKTTTTALLSSVLLEAGSDPSFVVGGVVQSLHSNARKGDGPYFVAEADESDGSFLKTASFGAIVTNCENEHLDYWGSEESLTSGFKTFFSQVKHKEHLFWCKDDPRLCSLNPPGFSYGFSSNADLKISRFRQNEKGIVFDLHFQGKEYKDIFLALFGIHNALNGSAVFGLSLTLQIDEKIIRKAFSGFQGVKRRLEWKGEAHGVCCFDDYGHHPTEIAATLKALRNVSKEKRVVVVFQPHRFTRTKALWNEFIACFEEADLLFVTDIHKAGELPIEGITGERLALSIKKGIFLPEAEIENGVARSLKPFDVLLTIGAGSVTKWGIPILNKYASFAPKYTVGVLSGGTSSEHEVSLTSAKNIASVLDKTFYTLKHFHISKEGKWDCAPIPKELMECDIAIPVFHGPQGEDGMIQGFLDTLQIPYVGCDYRSSALCMNKAWTKQVASAHQIPIVPYIEMDFATYRENRSILVERVRETLTFPVWVKAVHLGSSIGVSRALNFEELLKAADDSFSLDDQIIVEQEIRGREIEFAVLGNEGIRVAAPCAILNGGEFYDYEKKYGSNAVSVEVPAKITEVERQIGEELALRAYKAMNCKGLARVDFFLDRRGVFWLNEINPFPGFTANSGYPKMWEGSGMSQKELMNELIILGFARSRALARIRGV
jgi:UDP-N-acetylmuramate--alanine ligase